MQTGGLGVRRKYMNTRLYAVLLIVAVLAGGGIYAVWMNRDREPVQNQPVPPVVVVDPLNATYLINDRSITLVKGKAETGAGSAKVSTSIVGQPAMGDLNGDGINDAALFITQTTGGSGAFYYVAASMDASSGMRGTNALLLGDRITPQNIGIKNGGIVANYVDRKKGEPMTTAPSVGVRAYFSVNGLLLNRIASPAGTISFLSSKEVSTKYCNGADMDSVGYQKTITVEHMTSTLEKNPTPLQIVKETLHAATTGMCQTVLDQLNIMEKDGTVTIPPMEGWAGVSITMCTCKPIVETNILRIPGMTKVVWQ